MIIKQLSSEEFSEIYLTYMVKDFPDSELKPLERILETMQTGLSVTYGFYTERENPSEALRGYAVFVIPQGLKYGLLDYLAILPAYRGSGIGQWFFAEISQILLQKNPKLQGFFIETEAVTFAPDEVQRQVREKRNRFYKRCGCLPAKLGSRLFGVTYMVLYFIIANNLNAENLPNPSRNDLDDVYKHMFPQYHYERHIALWEEE